MALALNSEPVGLPRCEVCATWSAEAREAFNSGVRSWPQLLDAPARALQTFRQSTGHDAALWVAAHPWTDAENRTATLVTLYFGTDARVTRDELASLSVPLERSGIAWSADGVHALAGNAFPVLATARGSLLHLWVDPGDGGAPFATVLRGVANRARQVAVPWNAASENDFIPLVEHAVARVAPADEASVHHKEQLKLAFAMQVAHRVVEADGVVDSDEQAFLTRAFPDVRLASLWLDDEGLRVQLARQAELELSSLLGYHEKLALLSTFFAACYADGRLEVRELKVLKEASEVLGMDRNDVVAYLQRMW